MKIDQVTACTHSPFLQIPTRRDPSPNQTSHTSADGRAIGRAEGRGAVGGGYWDKCSPASPFLFFIDTDASRCPAMYVCLSFLRTVCPLQQT